MARQTAPKGSRSPAPLSLPLRGAKQGPTAAHFTPDVLTALQRCHDEGLTLDQSRKRIEVETGTLLTYPDVCYGMRAVAAATIDALRSELPDFHGSNLERCEYYLGEVAAIGSTFRTRDAELYLKFVRELESLMLLQERIKTQQLQATQQNLTVNVTDASASNSLLSKLNKLLDSPTPTPPEPKQE